MDTPITLSFGSIWSPAVALLPKTGSRISWIPSRPSMVIILRSHVPSDEVAPLADKSTMVTVSAPNLNVG
jgi:hypothetical protein